MMALVSVTGLRREYSRAGKSFAAVDGVNFSMEYGERVSITGRSGSGKTTFIGMLAGLISPGGGEILLDGKDITALGDKAMSRLRNTVIGYVPQGASLLPTLTALDNVRLPLYLAGGTRAADGAEKAFALLEAVGAAHLCDACPHDMSGGEMRRVAIARALVNAPKLLLADEPTSDLDEETAGDVMRLLSGVNEEGTALLVVTHDRELAGTAGRILTMASGRFAHGAPAL